ncbi:MAG: hypothetical protein K2J68_07850, partial [Treponemataceae bacterium]|nr:hypothetical protein [Treponemataceae bacterium]
MTTPFPNCQTGSFPSPGNPADQTSCPSFTGAEEKRSPFRDLSLYPPPACTCSTGTQDAQGRCLHEL